MKLFKCCCFGFEEESLAEDVILWFHGWLSFLRWIIASGSPSFCCPKSWIWKNQESLAGVNFLFNYFFLLSKLVWDSESTSTNIWSPCYSLDLCNDYKTSFSIIPHFVFLTDGPSIFSVTGHVFLKETLEFEGRWWFQNEWSSRVRLVHNGFVAFGV